MAYTQKELDELHAAAERMGLFENTRNSKVKRLADRRAKPAKKKPALSKPPRFETEEQRRDRVLALFKLKPLQRADYVEPYDVTNPTRYAEVKDWTGGDSRLRHILERYGPAMSEKGITAQYFKNWRVSFMMMTPEQLGALLRVTGRTIRRWESGKGEIPFSMWWMIHCTLQDPDYFLSRPGFHDFYIEYENGTALLCSRSYPDIRQSPGELFVNRAALNEVLVLREEMKRQKETLDEMTAENTKLRQLLKAQGVTAELQAMQDHITDMMKRISTADVLEFPESKESAEIVPLPRQASA